MPDHARFTYLGDAGAYGAARGARDRTGRSSPSATTAGIDEDGYVFLDGRREDLIVSGGVNVYPAEVEQVLAAHPGVREVAVYGVPDPQWGERVCAAVVGEADPDAPARLGARAARAGQAAQGLRGAGTPCR